MSDNSAKLDKLIEEIKNKEAYPIFAGAVAAAKSFTLVTDKYPFIMAMVEAKANIELIPERFQRCVEYFDIKSGHFLKESEEANSVFWLLQFSPDKIRWVYYWGPLSHGRGSGYLGNQYIMEDTDATTYIAKEEFTPKELEWLWAIAQDIHVLSSKPVLRR